MRLSQCETIIDEAKFIDSHKAVINNAKCEKAVIAHERRLEKYNQLKKNVK